MSNELNDLFNKFFEDIADLLDISDTHYKQAEARYKALCNWLGREESAVARFNPNMYPQGSFLLGTVNKVLNHEERYDIDFVCEVNLSKNEIAQKKLKELIGSEIISYAKANNMDTLPEDCKRCWKLTYAEAARFHMDILPAVPDSVSFEMKLAQKSITNQWSKYAIAITDKTLPNYACLDPNWLVSNPKGYAEWFKKRMETRILKETLKANIESVPKFRIKTPLQRVIQILKRHRDFMFIENQDDKPISIIITTLAAHAYNNEADTLNALINIISRMPNHIEIRNGITWIPNPVNPLENFADKWEGNAKLEENFRNWLQQVQRDLNTALSFGNLKAFGEFLKPRLGEAMVNKALTEFPQTNGHRSVAIINETLVSPNKFDVPHRHPPRWPFAQQQGEVKITAEAYRDGFRPSSIQNATSLPKHYSLRFKAKTNISWPYKVYWQVVNTGGEARAANCLRGEFYDGVPEKGGRVRRESTLYTGMHWTECFIVKDGFCVARSREFIVNIE